MKVSELIKRLERHLEVNGPLADYEIWIQGLGPLETGMRVSTSFTLFVEHVGGDRCPCFDCVNQRVRQGER